MCLPFFSFLNGQFYCSCLVSAPPWRIVEVSCLSASNPPSYTVSSLWCCPEALKTTFLLCQLVPWQCYAQRGYLWEPRRLEKKEETLYFPFVLVSVCATPATLEVAVHFSSSSWIHFVVFSNPHRTSFIEAPQRHQHQLSNVPSSEVGVPAL